MAESTSTEGRERFPQDFGRYTLKKRLGEGGMGEIYLASLQGGFAGVEKACVIKKLRRNYAHDEEFVARFLDEARLMVQLSHANIVPVFDAGTIEGDYFLAMELVDGVDLRELCASFTRKAGHGLTQPLALYVAREILSALGYAHRKTDADGNPLGLVHRDISPQNILCSVSGEVKLIDFGLAKSSQKVLKTDPKVVLGKYAYMSPEQARGQPVDGRSDLFAVGLLIFEMMCNRKLFDGVTVGELMEQIADHRVLPPGKVIKGVDPEIDAIVNKALLKDVNARYQSAEEFRDAITPTLNRLAPALSSDDLAREVRRARQEAGMPVTSSKGPPVTSGAHAVRPDEPTGSLAGAAPAALPSDAELPDSLKPKSTELVRSRSEPKSRRSSPPPAAAPPPAPASPPDNVDDTPPMNHASMFKLAAIGLGIGAAIAGLVVLAYRMFIADEPAPPRPPVAAPADAKEKAPEPPKPPVEPAAGEKAPVPEAAKETSKEPTKVDEHKKKKVEKRAKKKRVTKKRSKKRR